MTDVWIPFKEQVKLPAHRKIASCLALNPKCNRMATGGYDSIVKLWDFQGLTKALKSFKEFEPIENHIIRAMEYNSTGSSLLVAPGGRHCRMYDQNGEYLMQSVGGDMYVRDQMKTNGHTGSVVGCGFDFEKKEIFYTAGQDGTMRSWDTTQRTSGLDKEQEGVGVWRVLDSRGVLGRNCVPSSFTVLPDNKLLAAGCSDGSIQLVNHSKKAGPKPEITLRTAQKAGFHSGDVTALLSLPGRKMASRGLDGKVLVWDLANPKQPLHDGLCLPTEHETANLAVSPCGKYLLGATAELDRSTKTADGAYGYTGYVRVWDVEEGSKVKDLPLPAGGLQVAWGRGIEQLFVTLTTGEVLGCYDERSDMAVEENEEAVGVARSRRGLLLSIHTEAKKEEEGAVAMGKIWTEEDWVEAGFREGRDGDLRLTREAKRKLFGNKMETPASLSAKWGAGGALAAGGTFTDYLAGSLAKGDARSGQEDAQKALQEYAAKMEAEGVESTMFAAYKHTQPERMLDRTTYDDLDAVSQALQLKQKCPACGLKLCSCPPTIANQAKRPKRMDNWD